MTGLRQVEWKNALMKIKLYFCGPTYKEYDVYLVEGDWFPNYDLITICDGGDPARSWDDQMHDGGEVIQGESLNHRVVRVFSGSAVNLDEDE